MTTVVNLRQSPYDVYIGRAGHGKDGYFGNPFKLAFDTPIHRKLILSKYREYFNNRLAIDPIFRDRIHSLKGKTLGCFCKPKLCHGDIIAEYLNSIPSF
jgi:hypothetical protein